MAQPLKGDEISRPARAARVSLYRGWTQCKCSIESGACVLSHLLQQLNGFAQGRLKKVALHLKSDSCRRSLLNRPAEAEAEAEAMPFNWWSLYNRLHGKKKNSFVKKKIRYGFWTDLRYETMRYVRLWRETFDAFRKAECETSVLHSRKKAVYICHLSQSVILNKGKVTVELQPFN